MNAFIAFLALKMDLHSLMFGGALFQARVASFMNVEVAFSETPSSNRLPFVIALEHLAPSLCWSFLMKNALLILERKSPLEQYSNLRPNACHITVESFYAVG